MSDWLERRVEELEETNRQHLVEIQLLRAVNEAQVLRAENEAQVLRAENEAQLLRAENERLREECRKLIGPEGMEEDRA